jgi:bifunctional ADP-heptose synthase (sugar kinase/adenylyltransferase)
MTFLNELDLKVVFITKGKRGIYLFGHAQMLSALDCVDYVTTFFTDELKKFS